MREIRHYGKGFDPLLIHPKYRIDTVPEFLLRAEFFAPAYTSPPFSEDCFQMALADLTHRHWISRSTSNEIRFGSHVRHDGCTVAVRRIAWFGKQGAGYSVRIIDKDQRFDFPIKSGILASLKPHPVYSIEPEGRQAIEEADRDESRTTEQTAPRKKRDRYVWLVSAMTSMGKHPSWTDAKIAEAVGVHPGQLSRNDIYQRAAALVHGEKVDIRQGHRTAGGGIEAHTDH